MASAAEEGAPSMASEDEEDVEVASLPPTTPRTYTCEVCDKVFPTSTRYHKHIKLHDAEKTFHCTFPGCGKSFKRKPHLQRHMAQHQEEKPHVCDRPGCGKTFASQQRLAKHVRCIHEGFRCDVCGERFRKQGKLQTHMLTHDAKVEPTAPANPAAPGFPAALGLPAPPGLPASPGFPVAPGDAAPGLPAAPVVAGLTCPKCGKVVENAQAMHRHLKRHKEHRCEPCGAIFAHFTDLVHHRRAEHTKMHACSDCGMTFHREGHLRTHALRVHSREVLVCPRQDCGQVFASKSNLRVHERTSHERLKLFPCDKCSASFAYRHVMVRHQQTMHSQDRAKMSVSAPAKQAAPRAASGQVLLKRPPPGRKRKAESSKAPDLPASSSGSRPRIELEDQAGAVPSFTDFLEKVGEDQRSKAELEAEAEAALEAMASSVPLDFQAMADRQAEAKASLETPASEVCVGPCRCVGACIFGRSKSLRIGNHSREECSEAELSEHGQSEEEESEEERSEEDQLEADQASSALPAHSDQTKLKHENSDPRTRDVLDMDDTPVDADPAGTCRSTAHPPIASFDASVLSQQPCPA